MNRVCVAFMNPKRISSPTHTFDTNSVMLLATVTSGRDDKIKQLHKELDLEIQEIQGIGPTTVRKLNEAGIVTVMDLAVSRADELAVDINASKESTAALITGTQKLPGLQVFASSD